MGGLLLAERERGVFQTVFNGNLKKTVHGCATPLYSRNKHSVQVRSLCGLIFNLSNFF